MRRPPLSAVFSPSVRLPLRFCGGRVAVRRTRPQSRCTRRLRNRCAAVNALRSAGVHQSRRLPLPSNFEPWSSKPWVISWPMTTPMPPKLTRGIDGEIEERRLQDSGREVDVVEGGAVVGVHRGRRHAPLFLVHGLAQLGEVVVALVEARVLYVADEMRRGSLSRLSSRATFPDSRSYCGSWPAFLRRPFWFRRSSRAESRMSSASAFSRAATSLSMLALAAGGKFCLTQSWPTASPSAASVARVHCLQRGCGSFCPPRVSAEESGNSRRRKGFGKILRPRRAAPASADSSSRRPVGSL